MAMIIFVVELTTVVLSNSIFEIIQPTFTCSKSTIETLEKRCEICSKLTIKTIERGYCRHSGVFIVNFEHYFLVFSSV